jgi:hypothetical protein
MRLVSKKLNSSSQVCPVGRRDWQPLTNQLLLGPLQRALLHQTAHPIKESLGSNIMSQCTLKLNKGHGNIHCHTAQHTNLKKGQRYKKPLSKVLAPGFEIIGKSPENSLN